MKRITLALVAGLVLAACVPAQTVDRIEISDTGVITWGDSSTWEWTLPLQPGDEVVRYDLYLHDVSQTGTDTQDPGALTHIGSSLVETFAYDLTSLPVNVLYGVGISVTITRQGVEQTGGIGWSWDQGVVLSDRILIGRDGTVVVGTIRGMDIQGD